MVDKFLIAAYGLFLIVGAYFGWKAGSKVSLIMGLASGLLVFVGLYLTGLNLKNGYLFLTIIGAVLTLTFVMRFLKTHHFMPAGMLLTISLIFFIFCLFRFLKG